VGGAGDCNCTFRKRHPDVLRHRVVLSYEAEAEEGTAEDIVKRVFEVIEVP
jgi:MoxR-like ATPase